MLKNTFTNWLGYCLFNLLWITPALSQTISGVTFSPAEVCAGGTLEVTFTKAGTFNASNKFSVELSAAGGSFASKTILEADATSPATVTIPATTVAGTTYKIRVVSTAPVKGDTASTVLTVTAIPTVPVLAETTIEYCVGATAAVLPQATNRVWYAANTGGTALAPTFKPATNAAGPVSYWAANKVGDCESERTEFKVIVGSLAAPTLSSSVVEYCVGDVAVVLPHATGRVWYAAETGGTALATTFKPATSAAGSTSYWAENQSGGCVSERAKLTVTVGARPANAVLSSTSIPYCKNGNAVILPDANKASRKWYTTLTGGTALAAAFIPSTSVVGTVSYYASEVSGNCESTTRQKFDVIVNDISVTPDPVALSYCIGATVPANIDTEIAGTNLKWYSSLTGGSPITKPVISSSAAAPIKTYYVSQTETGKCESTRAKVTVIINSIPAKPVTIDLNTVCQETTVANTLLVNAVTKANGATLKWYTALTGGTGVTATPAINTTQDGLKEYFVSQTVNGCESARDVVKLEVKALPAAPVVVSPLDYCVGEKAVALTAEKSPTNNTLNWYTAATGGVAVTTAPVPATTTPGNKNNYVSQVQTYTITGGTLKCESKRSTIVVTTNALPAAPTATDLVQCQTRTAETVALTATASPATNTLKWYEAATGGTGDSKAPVIDKSKVVEKTYYVTQVSAKNCESTARKALKVRIKLLPGAPGVATVEKCQFDTPEVLTASTATGASLRWWGGNETGGNVSTTAPTPVYEKGESSRYFVSQILEGCESDRAKIDVVVKTTPVPNVATPNYTYCQNDNAATLTAQGQRLTWYFGSQSGPDAFAPPTGNIGTVAYYVAQTGDNGCISPKAEIKVTVNPKPSSVMSGTQSVELGQPADIKIDFTGGGPWEYVLSDDTEGVAETSPLILKKTPQQTTTYSVKEVKNVCGLGTPNGSALVTVLIPAINTGNPAIANICADKSFTIPFQASAISVDTYEYKLQISKDTNDENFVSIPTTVVRNSSNATGIIPDTTSGGDYYIRLIVESPYYETPVKGSISQVSLTVMPLPVATVTGSKTILVGESAVVQIDFSGSGPWHFAMSDNEELTTTSLTPYYKTVTPATTTTYQVLSVQNECGAGRIEGEARIQVDPILSNEPQPSAGDWLKVFPVPVELNLTVQIEKNYLQGTVIISVLDMMGRPVRSQKTDHTVTEVDFAQLPGGVYFVKVENGDLSSVTKVLKY